MGRGGGRERRRGVVSLCEMGKGFCPNFLQPFLENVGRRNCDGGCRKLISSISPKMPILSFGGGSHLGVP